jgi:hypothetical protein
VSHGDIRLSDGSVPSADPAIVWADDDFIVVWSDGGAVLMARLDPEGEVVTEATLVSGTEDAREPDIVWAGGLLALAWADGRGVHLGAFSKEGNVVIEPFAVSAVGEDAFSPAMAAGADSLGLAWRTGGEELRFAVVIREGCP